VPCENIWSVLGVKRTGAIVSSAAALFLNQEVRSHMLKQRCHTADASKVTCVAGTVSV
jgi:hypothetical protein